MRKLAWPTNSVRGPHAARGPVAGPHCIKGLLVCPYWPHPVVSVCIHKKQIKLRLHWTVATLPARICSPSWFQDVQ